MSDVFKIFGIYGSLRKNSYNKAVLESASRLLPQNVDLEIFDRLSEVPLFNQDDENFPSPAVVELKQKVRQADAIIFSTPEYNYSFPGVLKNTIDWASRPYGDNAWEGKPVAIMSASISILGGVRAQLQLRQVFIFLNMHPLNRPEVIIPNISEKINQRGELIDESTQNKIAEQIQALIKWTIELRSSNIQAGETAQEKYPYQAHYARTGGKPIRH